MLDAFIVDIDNLSYDYSEEGQYEQKKSLALDDVSLHIREGEMVAILGANGSGKSTFARHLNALLLPKTGEVVVCGFNTSDKNNIFEIRKNVGIVFQNPDNQIIASIVEEDIGFGLENLNVPTEDILLRVDEVLEDLSLSKHRLKSPNRLSGGQKQRVAIAGILAMKPKIVVFDESTAMLDPSGREQVMSSAKKMHDEGITVIIITHYMDEVTYCDKVFVMSKSKLIMDGTPRQIFLKSAQLESLKLSIPNITKMALELNKYYDEIKTDCLYMNEFIHQIMNVYRAKKMPKMPAVKSEKKDNIRKEEILRLENVNYSYSSGNGIDGNVLKDINLTIYKGEFLGIIGHTGSGKSTLIQHFNGLNKPTSGSVFYKNKNIFDKDYSLREHKGKVGLVFQYAEQQLFEINVLEDVMFGPLNQGKTRDEAQKLAKEAIEMVGLSEDYYSRSPFELSGGEKRRTAIAGVLAMKPEILVLDEPTSGLDPVGKELIFELLFKLKERGITIVIVSHSMEDVSIYADRAVVINDGSIAMCGDTTEVLSRADELKKIRLNTSYFHQVLEELYRSGLNVDMNAVSFNDVIYNILSALSNQDNEGSGIIKND